jgi:hypothetical protein
MDAVESSTETPRKRESVESVAQPLEPECPVRVERLMALALLVRVARSMASVSAV